MNLCRSGPPFGDNCNQILHSLTAILRENPTAGDVAPTVVWDIPDLDPVRGSEPDPQTAFELPPPQRD